MPAAPDSASDPETWLLTLPDCPIDSSRGSIALRRVLLDLHVSLSHSGADLQMEMVARVIREQDRNDASTATSILRFDWTM
jgi:hypothetical protein